MSFDNFNKYIWIMLSYIENLACKNSYCEFNLTTFSNHVLKLQNIKLFS